MSYPPVKSLQQRKRGHRSLQHLLPTGDDPDGHEGAVVGSVGLFDAHELDPSLGQSRRSGLELHFTWNSQHDGVGSTGKVSGATLPGGVHDLGGLNASREIRAHDDVVAERGIVLDDAVAIAGSA